MSNWEIILKKRKIDILALRIAYGKVIAKYNPIKFTLNSFGEKLIEEYLILVPRTARKLTGASFSNSLTKWLLRDGFRKAEYREGSSSSQFDPIDSFGETINQNFWIKEGEFKDRRTKEHYSPEYGRKRE